VRRIDQEKWVKVTTLMRRRQQHHAIKVQALLSPVQNECSDRDEGRTAKEITRALTICEGAVDIYQHLIRRKLGITTVKTNLLSLSPQ
jgi:DNA-binding NarL/FixJ family response regulator